MLGYEVDEMVAEHMAAQRKHYRCRECGLDGKGGCVENMDGRVWHFRANIEKGKIAPIRCYGKVEEVMP